MTSLYVDWQTQTTTLGDYPLFPFQVLYQFCTTFLNLLLYSSLYYAKACKKFAGPISASLGAGWHSSFRRNVAAVPSRWQHCVRFHWPGIWTSDLPLQRRTRYCSTNCPVAQLSTLTVFNRFLTTIFLAGRYLTTFFRRSYSINKFLI